MVENPLFAVIIAENIPMNIEVPNCWTKKFPPWAIIPEK